MTLTFILQRIPFVDKMIQRFVSNHIKRLSGRKGGDKLRSVTNVQTFKQIIRKFTNEIFYTEAEVGKPAINSRLYDFEKKSFKNLIDFANLHRPLVINFGSCT